MLHDIEAINELQMGVNLNSDIEQNEKVKTLSEECFVFNLFLMRFIIFFFNELGKDKSSDLNLSFLNDFFLIKPFNCHFYFLGMLIYFVQAQPILN